MARKKKLSERIKMADHKIRRYNLKKFSEAPYWKRLEERKAAEKAAAETEAAEQ